MLRSTLPDGKVATADVSSLSEDSGSVVVNALILIDPFGIVYEADTGNLVQGATVALRYLDGSVLPIPLLDGIGASPNLNNINPFVSTDIGGYAFLFGGDQVGSIDQSVEYTMTVELPDGNEYMNRTFRLEVQPTTPGPVQDAIIGMWAHAEDGMQMAKANDVALTDESIYVPDIETIAFNIPVFRQRPDVRLDFEIEDSELGIGDETVLRYTLRNVGDGAARQIALVDSLSNAWEVVDPGPFLNVGGVLTFDQGDLEPGQEVVLEVRVRLVQKPEEGDQITERARLSGASLAEQETAQTIRVLEPAWRLEMRAMPELVSPGEEFVYTLAYYNDGEAVGRNMSLIDILPGDMELIEAPGAQVDGNTLVWSVPDLAPGAADSVQIRVRLRGDAVVGVPIENEAYLQQADGLGQGEVVRAASASFALQTEPPDVDIQVSVNPTEITVGDRATVSISIRDNDGRQGTWTVRDTLSGGLVFVEGSSSRPVNYDAVTGIIEWQVDSAEGAVEWTYQVEPRDDLAPGTHPMQSRVQATMGNVTVQSEAVIFTAVVAYFEIAITVDQPTIELGDFVRYDLDLANLSSHDSLAVLLVRMQIPEGFTYVNGTSLFEGQEVTTLEESGYRPAPRAKRAQVDTRADSTSLPELLTEPVNMPLNTEKQLLEWFLPGMSPGDKRLLSFSAVAGVGAENSSGKAQAAGVALTTTSLVSLASNITQINVRVRPSAMFSLGQLTIGRAWVDRDGNGLVDPGEPPVPGVVLTMENGTRVVADADGRFSIPEVERGDHVLRLSPDHIPADLEPVAYGTRSAGDPWTRFVHFGRANLAKVNVPFREIDSGYLDQRLFAMKRWWLDRTVQQVPVQPLQTLHFETATDRVDESYHSALADLVHMINALPGLRWAVAGHADATPIATDAFADNDRLSMERAQSVADWLVAAGVDANQLDVVSYGDQRPVADNSTAVGRRQNRRVELKPLLPELPTLYFASGSGVPDFSNAAILKNMQALSMQLQAVPSLHLVIEGHADAQRIVRSDFSDNDQLALARAQSVADWLVEDGVRTGQISVKGASDRQPVAENETEQGRGKNRRAEMAFVLPKLYQVALHGRWEAPGDRNADLLQSETADSEDVGAYIESKETIEIKQLMSGAYPEHKSFKVGARDTVRAYVTAQLFGVDSLGAPQSAHLSWEALGRGRALDVWGAEVRSADAPARARWAPAPYRAASHWWLDRSMRPSPIEPLEPFYFEPGSAKLVEGNGSRIDALAEFMTSVPAVRVRIEGHADIEPIFNADYYSNADLSADRAEILSKKLQWRGIAAERIEVVAHAADRPADDNATALGRRNNRRAEVRLLWPEGQTLHYDSGSDKLSDAAQLALLAAPLLSTPSLRIVVEGHADSQSPAKGLFVDNRALALARAQGVADALEALGVRPSQMRVASRGDEAPLADNGTRAGRAKNRRVEVSFIQPESYELGLETYAPPGTEPIELVQALDTAFPTPISRTMHPSSRVAASVTGQLDHMDDWKPPQAARLRWHQLDSSPHADRWVAGYTDADTSASGQGIVARVGSRWTWELAAQSARPAQVHWDLPDGLSPTQRSLSAPDTLRQLSTLSVGREKTGQALITTALHAEASQRVLLADTLTVPVDASPWWQWNTSEDIDSTGARIRTVHVVYRGLKTLSLVHVGEHWDGDVALSSEDESLLHREDGAVKIWRDVAPGALLELRYRVSTDAAANPRPFVHYEVEGVWCEEPLEKDGEEVSR